MSQNLRSELLHYFFQRIRAKGSSYFHQDRVELTTASEFGVEAFVKGSRRYQVSLKLYDQNLSMHCNCPYMKHGADPCEHLWAVILAASAKGVWKDVERITWDTQVKKKEADGKEAGGKENSNNDIISGQSQNPLPSSRQAKPGDWKGLLKRVHPILGGPEKDTPYPVEPREILVYVIEVETSQARGAVVLQLYKARPKKNGQWDLLSHARFGYGQSPVLEARDLKILSLLRGFKPMGGYSDDKNDMAQTSQFQLLPEAARMILPLACATGRCLWEEHKAVPDSRQTLQWDPGEPWHLRLELVPATKSKGFILRGDLRRQTEKLSLDKAKTLPGTGLAVSKGTLFQLNREGEESWMKVLASSGSLAVPLREVEDFLSRFFQAHNPPELELPKSLRLDRKVLDPKPVLLLNAVLGRTGIPRLSGDLFLDYEGVRLRPGQGGTLFYRPKEHLLLERNLGQEREFVLQLATLGFKPKNDSVWGQARNHWELPSSKLPDVVAVLVPEGWRVEAQGKLYRSAPNLSANLQSGVDWFDLSLTAHFDGVPAPVEHLLDAIRKGEKIVRLDDGTFGVLPEEWLAKYGLISRLGKTSREGLRFSQNQLGVLDALLVVRPEVSYDEAFARARERLRNFDGVKPVNPPKTFQGTLRPYQKEGLGWIHFLRDFGFGGCLADDMGLGKTVQVLALLEERRSGREPRDSGEKPEGPRTSLVVMPKSLIFNWKKEAVRFTPELRILDYTGTQRRGTEENLSGFDLVITTYGTLRRDIAYLSAFVFDYAILDEAQAVKNAKAETAKAVRLLKASHRLALTGTPIQNSLDELWSLFEFLNPGMLGSSAALSLASSFVEPEAQNQGLLARALRPFLLRRTKETVAKDLPSKTEQILYCEMNASQRALYDGLRQHYRQSLMRKVEKEGLNRSKMHVLEALLRLRQAACHPGLINPASRGDLGAKLDMLFPQLEEVLEEGHKALVFSQFTSFLDIVRAHLDPKKISYAYLDGKSRDRQEQVERFQDDPDCRLFLISLKAGGLGLNLTAADYVYLLDPWWNPAVEAQAVDRVHRIGQKSTVFVYRMVTAGTIEERIQALKASKKDLFDKLIGGLGGDFDLSQHF
ncbi:MAG TPA: SNF2-related protein, partial [bacterium]